MSAIASNLISTSATNANNLFQIDEATLALARRRKRKQYSSWEVDELLTRSEKALDSLEQPTDDHFDKDDDPFTLLEEAERLCNAAGLRSESDLSREIKSIKSHTGCDAALTNKALSTTGGHSNVDHEITWSGDHEADRIAHLSRRLISRVRAQAAETVVPDNRWDKKKIPGERRRRIVRDVGAPPPPPLSGYILFLGQMTVKWRHDRPNQLHRQNTVMSEVCKLWKNALSDGEKDFFNRMSDEIREEHKEQLIEYRATGVFTPSDRFERFGSAGLWMHKHDCDRTGLEKEISSYETVVFPPRPPEFDEDYNRRLQESIERRKAKIQREREDKYRRMEEKGIKFKRRKLSPRKKGQLNEGDRQKGSTQAGATSNTTESSSTQAEATSKTTESSSAQVDSTSNQTEATSGAMRDQAEAVSD